MSYGETKAFLARHTQLVELTDAAGACVAICPQWQGRVMTSTCGGAEGPSFGFVNREFIEVGKLNPQFNNYGGEERMWLSPEGGQFSLWFKPGAPQTLDHWYTAPALNEGGWNVVSRTGDRSCRMTTMMKLENASATRLDLEVTRDVQLLDGKDLTAIFGPSAKLMEQPGVRLVAYETANQVTNRGSAMTREKGLLSIWILSMLNSGPQTVVVAPYRSGDEGQLGQVVKSDYFGEIPPGRLKILPAAVLFRADGNCRAKIGISQRRALSVLGSIDFAGGVLTLAQFTMPEDPTRHPYMNNMWGGPHADPFTGDVANGYNDGPPAPGKKGLGPFYEIESLSPAAELGPGQSLMHRHRTIHVQAEPAVLQELAEEILGVELEAVRKEMLA